MPLRPDPRIPFPALAVARARRERDPLASRAPIGARVVQFEAGARAIGMMGAAPRSAPFAATGSGVLTRRLLTTEAAMAGPRSVALAVAASCTLAAPMGAAGAEPVYFDVPRGAHPHDVAATPVPGGPVYYTAQAT